MWDEENSPSSFIVQRLNLNLDVPMKLQALEILQIIAAEHFGIQTFAQYGTASVTIGMSMSHVNVTCQCLV